MSSVTVLYILCVLLIATSVVVFAYTALCIFKWKMDINTKIENLETSVNALRIETEHTTRLVEINDEAVDKFVKTNQEILNLNDELLRNNEKLTKYISTMQTQAEWLNELDEFTGAKAES